tara:strand:+ start:230 stop:412 length:183 start_codon:yes stop_codon:yes gene_type:complete
LKLVAVEEIFRELLLTFSFWLLTAVALALPPPQRLHLHRHPHQLLLEFALNEVVDMVRQK